MLVLLLTAFVAPQAHEYARNTMTVSSEPCPRTTLQWAKKNAQDAPVTPRKLDKEPEAEAYLGVLHRENGCEKPIKVNDWRPRRAR